MLTSGGYLRRAIRGWIAEKVVKWHRAGRVGRMRAFALAESAWRFLPHLPLAILPAGLHRFLTDGGFRKEKLAFLFVRPFRLYFNRELREQWLRDMVAEGRKKHMLSDGDAELIVSQINEPYIQRYLISLVVHLMTLPVTQVVSVICAVVYVLMHPEMPRAQAWGIGFGIIALFQVVPISPGSFCRGLWAVGIAIYDRSFKDYNIAVFLSFFKYIGYLAFPIQMTYHYPALARFMAGHWATEAVHIVPVFGERGALLEHWAFCLFYNWPLTIRRRMRRRAEVRAALKPRYWHVGVCAIAAAAGFGLAELVYLDKIGELPGKLGIWWLAITIPPACGAAVTLGCKGAALARRIAAAALCGVLVGVLYTTATLLVGHYKAVAVDHILSRYVGRMFVFSILSAIGAVIAELRLPEPSQKI